MKCRILLLFLLLLILPNYALSKQQTKDALPIELNSTVDKDSVNIGERIKYTITVRTRRGDVEVALPGGFEEDLGIFRVRDFGSRKSRSIFGRVTYSQWVILDTYKTGKHSIPCLIIKYRLKDAKTWQETETDKIVVEVKTLLDKEAEDIRDIKPPINFPVRYTPYIIALLLILLIAGFLARAFLKKKNEIEEVKIPLPRPAHVLAYEALERLKMKELPKQGKIKEYYIELSGIVRHYLEARFSLRAPEMTTEEFLSTLKDTREFSLEHKNLLRDFLIHSDLVKFAKHGPSDKEINLSFACAKRLIDQTKTE